MKEEINDTSVLEDIKQKLDSMSQGDKIHLIGDLACELFIYLRLKPSEEVEELGERLMSESEHMGKKEDAIALLKDLVNSL